MHSFEGAGVYDEVERSLVRRFASPLSKRSEWARKEEGVALLEGGRAEEEEEARELPLGMAISGGAAESEAVE